MFQITITAIDEFTSEQLEVVVHDGTSTGFPSANKIASMLNAIQDKHDTILTYVTHSATVV